MTGFLDIAGRRVGPGEPAYVVAEMSANHHQDLEKAFQILRAAREAGADAVKIQTYTPDTMTIPSDREPFSIGRGTLWEGRTLHDLYREAHTPWEWHPELGRVARELGLQLFSTPFDETAVEYLEEMNVSVYKVASFELVDIPLIRCIARTGKPIIMSTGMASRAEIEDALEAARGEGAREIALLKCTSAYPAPAESMNLRTIPDLAASWDVVVGLSDHSFGIEVPVAAVALGAAIVEKHFTLSRSVPGPDSAFSLEPDEFKAMVTAVRKVEQALGSIHYGVADHEKPIVVFRRSLFVVEDVEAGEELTRENVRVIRPGHGLAPKYLGDVLGRKASRGLSRGSPLSWSDLEGAE